MRQRLPLCLVMLAGLMLARPAAAQDPSRHLIFSTLGGWTLFDPDRDLRNRLYVGGRLGARGRYLGLEAAGGFTPTRQDAPGGRDVGWVHLSGNLMVYPLPGLPIEPYGLLGFGGEHFGGPGGEPAWHLSFDAGGGLIFLLSENLGLR